MRFDKYSMPKMIDMSSRTWPGKKMTHAPIWCSVDLRDGNQALEVPMDLNQKIQFFDYLVKVYIFPFKPHKLFPTCASIYSKLTKFY